MTSRFVFHVVGLPHTTTNGALHSHCAYSAKNSKFLKMMSRRGHTCIDYSNEGAEVPAGVEHVDIFTEEERAAHFGPHDPQKLYHIVWDPSLPYWREFNARAVERLRPRVKRGDFVLSLAGNCQVGPIGDAFPGSYCGTAQSVMLCEFGIGYYGTQSVYRIFESHSHREWVMGRADHKTEDNSSAVVPNYFDMDEFPLKPLRTAKTADIINAGPFYLFIGRVIADKGFPEAIEVVDSLRRSSVTDARLVIAGQGCADLQNLPEWVVPFGSANVVERASLMANAIAVINPTRFREPFGGTAVEAQLSGTPAITTDHGAFCETTPAIWRCASHRELCTAAERALSLSQVDRLMIRDRAKGLYSLEAVAPLYERVFQRYMDRWGSGYYQDRPIDPEEVRNRP
jgi:glycosyltransferase involved in cell wall biosynthesis